ncbi:omega-hydroxypalmitate O-feruloyl transferase [Dorcoceras hygrometricum]|uniref:Omega-hydroxypalmitate O-feruloyl transferase n=1 Tax=Dorcoceras hygrometricum TaxID=472368 RepID=A0A2Z7BUJ9_9LAMI|nr:omega-hydroxypalmitate O-feruloyl transferase [Dorcoceras hygrometricum]
MGTLHDSSIQDLNVKVHHSSLILPIKEQEREPIFLSNIDKVLDFTVQTVHFFPANTDFPPEVVAARLKNAIRKLMQGPYDFLAGKLNLNQATGRLEIVCNGCGVRFIEASTKFMLEELGDLAYPNPAYRELIMHNWDNNEGQEQPLCIFQVTSFECGGLALGISTNHALFDGLSFKIFLKNLASQAFDHCDTPLAIKPCHNRRLLAARSPPQVTFPHPEMHKLDLIAEQHPVFASEDEHLDFKIFNLSPNDITYLKQKAKSGCETTKITSFNVVTAHIWRCKALSNSVQNNRERVSKILYAVDIRSRLNPRLPHSYCGNAVLSAYAAAKCMDLEDEPFSKLVNMVSDGAARMTDEYVRSSIDWGEIHRGFPDGEVLISSWWRLGFDEVMYPWGKPTYSCPVVYHRKHIILLFSDVGGGGVNVSVALPAKELKEFEQLFYKYL